MLFFIFCFFFFVFYMFFFFFFFFFSSRRRHTRSYGDWSSDVCSSDLNCRQGECVAATAKRQFGNRFCSERIHYQLARGLEQMRHVFSDRNCLCRSEERRVGKECRSRWWLYH